MKEIRTIKQNELKTFFNILCETFQLHRQKAESLFYRNPLLDLTSCWAYYENHKMRSILTTTPLEFGDGPATGIAGVATSPEFRGQGFSKQLIQEALRHTLQKPPLKALLFAEDTRLYEQIGFKKLDRVIQGSIKSNSEVSFSQKIEPSKAHTLYDLWAMESIHRLKRDSNRWKYWTFTKQNPLAFHNGYVVLENNLTKEIVFFEENQAWALPKTIEWQGLSTLTQKLKIPLQSEKHKMFLLGIGFEEAPELFMTDQF